MDDFELSINPVALVGLVFLGAIVGYAIRSGRTRIKQLRIRELKREIMNSHAQILELQKEFVLLESRMKNTTQIPALNYKPVYNEYLEEFNSIPDGFV
jgi:hypothetical protein